MLAILEEAEDYDVEDVALPELDVDRLREMSSCFAMEAIMVLLRRCGYPLHNERTAIRRADTIEQRGTQTSNCALRHSLNHRTSQSSNPATQSSSLASVTQHPASQGHAWHGKLTLILTHT